MSNTNEMIIIEVPPMRFGVTKNQIQNSGRDFPVWKDDLYKYASRTIDKLIRDVEDLYNPVEVEQVESD